MKKQVKSTYHYHYYRLRKALKEMNESKTLARDVLFKIVQHTPKGYGKCILWERCRSKQGYGMVRAHDRTYSAHRLAVEFKTKKPVTQGMDVCHSCDVHNCVNVNHLSVDTHQQNMKEAVQRNRMSRHRRFLSPEKVRGIRILYHKYGISIPQLRKNYGLSYVPIKRIVQGLTYRDVV